MLRYITGILVMATSANYAVQSGELGWLLATGIAYWCIRDIKIEEI